MKKLLYLFIAVFAVIIPSSFFLFSADAPIRNYPSGGTDIIAFRDSLVEGIGATEGNDFVSVLSRKIGQPIVNLGVSGNTTADGLSRVSVLDRYRPKVVLLLLGGNDHLRKVPEAETFANLAALIENFHARGAVVVLLGIRGSLLGDKFEDEFERLHEEYETAYVSDVLSGLFGRAEYMSDPIHPNDAGYAKIAERIHPVLESLLR